jgi:RNA polymerase sigma factor (sigma-70 family)
MDDNARCYIFSCNGYEEISYSELQERRAVYPAYAGKRFIPLHGMLMEVTETGYQDFYRNIRRQKYVDAEARRNGAVSYNVLDTDEMSGADIIADTSPPVDEQAVSNLLLEEMRSCFGRLGEADRELLTALYFDEKSARQLAKEIGVSKTTVNYRRRRAIARLKKMMTL